MEPPGGVAMTECAVATAASPPGGSGTVKEEAVEEEAPPNLEYKPHNAEAMEVVEPASPDTAMAERRIKVERAESPEIRITDSPPPPILPPPTSTSIASSPASLSSAFAKSPVGSPTAAAAVSVSPAASSPQPSLPSPPLLFQPFLPSVNKSAAVGAAAAAAKSGALPFSIDNILKPSFGHRLQLLQTVAVAAAAAAHRKQQQQRQHGLFPGDRLVALRQNLIWD